jgi:hypothetical protein
MPEPEVKGLVEEHEKSEAKKYGAASVGLKTVALLPPPYIKETPKK